MHEIDKQRLWRYQCPHVVHIMHPSESCLPAFAGAYRHYPIPLIPSNSGYCCRRLSCTMWREG